MNDVKIRKASIKDARNIVKLNDEVYKDMVKGRKEFFKPFSESPDMTEFFEKTISDIEALVLVAEIDGDFAGYVYASIVNEQDDLIDIPFVMIDQIAVVKDFRGKGLGKMLLAQAEQWAIDKSINVVQLGVFEMQNEAIKLYEKQGYKTIMRKMEKVLNQKS